LTVYVSFGSITVSPFTVTSKVCDVTPGLKVRVRETAT